MDRQPIPRSWYHAIAILLVLVVGNHYVADWITRHTKSTKAYWLIEAGPHQTDCVVLGSSVAMCSIDPVLFSQELGKDVLMMSEEGSAFTEQALIWNLFLEKNHCQFLILEVDPWGLTDTGYSWPFHEYNFLPFLNHPLVEKSVTEQKGFWRTAAWKYVPMLKFAEYNSQFGLLQLGSLLKRTPYNPRRSGLVYKEATPEVLKKGCQKWAAVKWEWDTGKLKALNDILDRAEDQNVRTILFYSPLYRDCHMPDEAIIMDYYRTLATKRKIPFIVIDNERIVSDPRNFKDTTHLNAHGAALFSQALAEQIKEIESTPP